MDETDWRRLVKQLLAGEVTPFLGAGASRPVLPAGSQLSRKWAEDYNYPFDDPLDLSAVMQYAITVEQDPVIVKQAVVDHLARFGEPDPADDIAPHALLARLPLSVFLTTNYDNFMLVALRRKGKTPRAVVCPWYRDSENDDHTVVERSYEPRADQPLIYHLHGMAEHPESLVLAEDDYIEFLANLAMEQGGDRRRIIPLQVRRVLTRRPLLFLGYSMRDWSFRMLFHGLVSAMPDVLRRRHVSVQLTPPDGTVDPGGEQRAKAYLERRYDGLRVSIYWGDLGTFCAELDGRLRDAA